MSKINAIIRNAQNANKGKKKGSKVHAMSKKKKTVSTNPLTARKMALTETVPPARKGGIGKAVFAASSSYYKKIEKEERAEAHADRYPMKTIIRNLRALAMEDPKAKKKRNGNIIREDKRAIREMFSHTAIDKGFHDEDGFNSGDIDSMHTVYAGVKGNPNFGKKFKSAA